MPGLEQHVLSQTEERPRFWLGALGCVGEGSKSPPLARYAEVAGAVTVVLGDTSPARQPFRPDDLKQLAKLFGQPERDESKQHALRNSIAADKNVVHLTASADEWVFYITDPSVHLWLTSPLRLPNVWDFSHSIRESGSAFVRVSACGGDLVVAMRGDDSAVERFRQGRVNAPVSVESTGASALRSFEEQLRAAPTTFSAAFVEVL